MNRARTLIARLCAPALVGAAALAVLAFPMAGAAQAGDVVIGFDNLPVGASVTNQYAAQGVELGQASSFGRASPGAGDCGSPTVSSGTITAHSTPNYAQLASCSIPGSVPAYYAGTYGWLPNAAASMISVEVASLTPSGPPVGLTLTGFDSSGAAVASASTDTAAGAWTALTATQDPAAGSTPAIRYFQITTTNSSPSPPQVAIDDLTFDQPSSAGSSPTADVVVTTPQPLAGTPITFSGAGSKPGQGTIVSYNWDFNGDGRPDTSTGRNPVATFIFPPGHHVVGLKVTNSGGKTSSALVSVNVTTAAKPPLQPDGGQGPCQSTYDNGNVHIVADCIQTVAGGGYVIQTHLLDLNGMTLAPQSQYYGIFHIQSFKQFGIGSGTELTGAAVNVELLNTPIGNLVLGGIDLGTQPIRLTFQAFVPPVVHLAGDRQARRHTRSSVAAASRRARSADAAAKTLLASFGVGEKCASGDKNPNCCPSGATTSCATLPGNFPLTGMVSAYLNNKGQVLFDVQVGLDLQAVNFQATGALEVIADLQTGIDLNSLQFTIPQAGLASIFQVKDASFVYYWPSDPDQSKADTWQAKATFIFGPLSQPSLAAELDFQKGQFHYASMLFTAPSGTGIPIYPGILLNQLGGSVGVNPFQFGGNLGASIATQLELSLSFKYAEPTDTQLGFFGGQGVLSLSSDKIATLAADVYSDGYTDASLDIDLHFPFDSSDPVVQVTGHIGFWDEPTSGRWEADGSVGLKLWVISAEVAGLVNNNYVAGCADVDGMGAQGRYSFADGSVNGGFFAFSNCSDQLKQYQQKPVTPHTGGFVSSAADGAGGAALTAADTRGGGTVRLPGKTLGQELLISSASGMPIVQIYTPDHRIYTTPTRPGALSAVPNRFISAVAPNPHQVLVLLRHPVGGVYNVQPTAASAAISSVRVAGDVPPAQISTKVRGRGRRRTLSYRIRNYVPGTRVQFVERGRDSTHVLATVHAASGRFHFTPQDAIARRRVIFAYLRTAGGAPLRTTKVGAYTAPSAIRGGRIRGLHFSRGSTTATLAWGATRGVRRYYVLVHGSDGRMVSMYLSARRRRLVLSGVLPFERFSAAVSAQAGPNLLSGPTRHITLPAAATGEVELLTCARGRCHGSVVRGTLASAAGAVVARLVRGGRTVATGIASDLRGPSKLSLNVRRAIGRGRYTLLLRYHRGGRTRQARRRISIR